MKISLGKAMFGVLLLGGAVAAISAGPFMTARAESPSQAAVQPQPVEKDMHEFMEYVFQPTYKRLKLAMATTPADNAAWKGIKADSLILAEGGNLLLSRAPEKDVAAWNEISAAVREAGGKLYQAAKAKDYAAAKPHYELMLKKCNACHDQFADGEHQLSP